MAKSFWLGIIGGIFGILGGIFAIMVGGLSAAFDLQDANTLFWLGILAIIVSIVGMVAGSLKDPRLGGWLLVASAIGIFIAISLFGVLPAILFLIGGVLKLTRND